MAQTLISLEMALYDDYRLLDGESSTPNYLSRCQQKLMTKVKESKTTINELEKEVDRVRLEKKRKMNVLGSTTK